MILKVTGPSYVPTKREYLSLPFQCEVQPYPEDTDSCEAGASEKSQGGSRERKC